MKIHGFNKTTLLDYPGHLASTIFVGSCNFRCPFCHNATLVLDPGSQPIIDEEEIFDHLKLRKAVLEGVCITGGEPTLMPDLYDFICRLKELSYLVKLDTNGTNPDLVARLANEGLIDYVAMDIKSSPRGYAKATGISNIDISAVKATAAFLMQGPVPYEFRTTAVRELISPDDFMAIGSWLHGAENYYLQGFKDSGDLIAPSGLSGYTRDELEPIKASISDDFKHIEIRGLD